MLLALTAVSPRFVAAPIWSMALLYVVIALLLAFSRLSVMDTTDLERVALQGVIDALALSHTEWKTAAETMGIDYAQFTRQLRGEPHQHLSFRRLLRLPFAFWLAFTPVLIALLYKKRLQEIHAELERLRRSA